MGTTEQANIFTQNIKNLTFEDYLQYKDGSRGNLGEELPVTVYRLLEYSLKEELIRRFGKDTQIDIFRSAGQLAGNLFCNTYAKFKSATRFFC